MPMLTINRTEAHQTAAALASDENWEVREGTVFLTRGPVSDKGDGQILGLGDVFEFSAGDVPTYRTDLPTAKIWREVL